MSQVLEQLYEKCDITPIIEIEPFDHNIWVKYFPYAINKGSHNIHQMRILIGQQTIRALQKQEYQAYDISTNQYKTVHISRDDCIYASKNSKKYDNEHSYTHKFERLFQNTSVRVLQGDCIEAALWLQNQPTTVYKKIAVLNMANPYTPGGGFKGGDGAQEENLHRRTNLVQCLENYGMLDTDRDWGYPIGEFGGIYTPSALVIRGSERKGYPFYLHPQKLDFISVAAYNRPELVQGRLVEEKAEGTKHKARTILNISLENKCYNVILSALGCGAFRNPPDHVSELFKEVIAEYRGCFENIIFAIIEDHNSRRNKEGNVIPFAKTFGVDITHFEY
jgi:uncharacterized protein (TIGR02452 family)